MSHQCKCGGNCRKSDDEVTITRDEYDALQDVARLARNLVGVLVQSPQIELMISGLTVLSETRASQVKIDA